VTRVDEVLQQCAFPEPGTAVDLAVSGGADSVGLTLLAVARGLKPTLHHVDHHLRPDSTDDARLVAVLAQSLNCPYVVHDVDVATGSNLEARARAARRHVLPEHSMTGHTMDDLAETVVLNLLRGAGLDGLSPMVGDVTKPLLNVRRGDVLDVVRDAGQPFVVDSTNGDLRFRRNRVRHEVLPTLSLAAERDLVPVLARQAALMGDERSWLSEIIADDVARDLDAIDCRELNTWATARLRRWLRAKLLSADAGDGTHPPSADEVERVIGVCRGVAVATELSGGRRVARSGQRLGFEKTEPLRSIR
jgi:tRNA(Ile)-lysidine synthase